MDPMWEFNAPQFVDFTDVHEDPKADEYFDMDHEAGDVEPGTSALPASHDDLSDCNTCDGPDKNTYVVHVADADAPEVDSASVKISDEPETLTTETVETNAVNNDDNEEAVVDQEDDDSEQCSNSVPRRSLRRSVSNAALQSSVNDSIQNVDTSPPQSNGVRAGKAGRGRRSSSASKAVRRSHSNTSHNKSSASANDSGRVGERRSNGSRVHKRSAKLTMPATPSWMKRYTAVGKSKQIKNSEHLEMEKIQELRKALADKRRIAAESCAKALQAVKPQPILAGQSLTVVQTFNFATDARLTRDESTSGKQKSAAAAAGSSEWKEVDFVKELRKNSGAVASGVPMKTIPQPFHLHSPKKRKSNADDKCETVAEKVAKFYSKTPDRFHSRRAGSHERSPVGRRRSCSEGRRQQLKPTIPKTPNLTTRSRARATHVVSQAELEQQEVEEMKKNQFKAKPLNEKILKQPFELAKNTAKGNTKPEEFHLETEERLRARKEKEEKSPDEASATYEFHANPIPAGILTGPVGVKPVKELSLTVPQSPAFASKYILRSSKPVKPPTPKEKKVIKAHAIPHTGLPFQPKFDHRTTVVAPFSFDERIQAAKLKKEEKLKEYLEEEKKAREFHATELKDLEPVLPPKHVKPITCPEPFQFEADKRAALKEIHYSQKVQQELQQQKEMSKFKAKPADVLKKAPYEPAKSAKPATVATESVGFKLSTERRAEERQKWERMNEEREAEAAVERMERERREQEIEEQEHRRLRSEAVHQAQPIRNYRPVNIQPSDKQLTVPETPAFSERLRPKTKQ